MARSTGSSETPVPARRGQEASAPRLETTYVVGIGASAGGLEALEAFFAHMPADTGLVFVVIQHLSPDYKSLMVELLSRHTQMAVVRAQNGMHVAPNTVYLIPPKHDMRIASGRLLLSEHDSASGIHLPIDIFFRSLAEDLGERAVGIVLSGTGSDGMRGVRAIKDAGGMVMVQSEEEAKFDGMPRSAISTGLVDFILPVAQLPAELLGYVRACGEPRPAEPVVAKSDEENLLRVADIIRRHTGVDFTHYKPATIVRRLERRMGINQVANLDEYIQVLDRSPRERTVLYKELLIGVTKFFRDTEAFQILRDDVIPAIFEESPSEPIRVWAPGCSTGEETYSLAMLFQEFMTQNSLVREVKIFATDIDREAVEFAAAGSYPESIVADVPPARLQRFFGKRGEQYVVNRSLREMVVFALQNLAKDPPLTRMDLVSCRNLLIYLQPVLQKKVLSLLAYALKPRGFLFLGPSETAGSVAHLFRTHSTKWKIYRSISGDRRSVNEALTLAGARSFGSPVLTVGRVGAAPSDEDHVLEKVYQELMGALSLRCIVLDQEFRIIHSFGEVGEILQLRPGRATLDLLKLVPKELVTPLRSALSRAAKDRREFAYEGIELRDSGAGGPGGTGGAVRRIDLRVRPLSVGRDDRGVFLVFFQDSEQRGLADSPHESVAADRSAEERIAQLERELQYSRENLQATIEELETSNEELQATNEELLASNEELQSTNEELQSVNEELQTVNAEYQQKIEELTQLYNDMENLLRIADTGMVFVDQKLQIRKFTPAVTRLLNVLPMDLGRPLHHISTRAVSIDLAGLAQHVLATGQPHEETIRAEDGSHLQVRIVPYLVEGEQPQGVVVHFVDITSARRTGTWLQGILDSMTPIVAVLDPVGTIELVNRSWEEFGCENGAADGVRLGVGSNYLHACAAAVAAGDPHATAAVEGIRAVLRGERREFQLEYPCDSGEQRRWFLMSASALREPRPGAIVWHLDITARKLADTP